MMTTSLDRLLAAANGKIIDHVPVFCNLLDQGAKEIGVSIQDYFANGDYVAEAQLSMLKNSDTIMFGVFLCGQRSRIIRL